MFAKFNLKNIDLYDKKNQLFLLIVVSFLAYFLRLWQGFLGGDESCYALLSREILRSGDWVVLHHPHFTPWQNYYEHPPLYMWITALNFKLFGINDFSAKLFSAASGFGSVLIVYFSGKRLVNHTYGYFAAFFLLTTEYFLDYGRKARLEIPLSFFIILSFLFVIVCLQERRLIWAYLGGLAAALAFLTKGLPGLSALLIAFIAFVFFSGSLKRALTNSSLLTLGLLSILGPWAILQFIYDNGRFFDWYFLKQVSWSMVGRRSNIDYSVDLSSILFYPKKLLIEIMVPWFLVAFFGAIRFLRLKKTSDQKIRYLIFLAVLIILGAFSLVHFKQTRYVLPAVPFLCLLAAEFFIERSWEKIVLKWMGIILIFFLTSLIVIAFLNPLPFSETTNDEVISLAPQVFAHSTPDDTLLVAGMKEYTVHQLFTWYFNRPSIICAENVFQRKWSSGKYRVGIKQKKTLLKTTDNVPESTAFLTNGSFQLYINSDN